MLRQVLSFASLLQLACVVTAQSSDLVRVCENLSASSMCYDETRGRLVFRLPNGGVIEHDGQSWSRAVEGQPTIPPSLTSHCVYESSRDRVYLVDNEVRVYDGNSIRSLGVAPSHTALCADSGRGRLVGIRSLGFLSGPMVVEEFDGSAWTQVASTPVGASVSSACYDPVLGKVVFCVTTYPSGAMPSERQTFEWNGSFLNGPFAQADLTPAENGSIAFDPVSRSVVGISIGAMVRWTGSAWTQMPIGGAPTRFSSLVTDHRNGRILAYDSSTQTLHTYDGSWSSTPAFAPVCGSGAVLHDPVRGKTMLIGTRPTGTDPRLLATFEQGDWEPIALDANAPSSFSGIASAFDEARGQLVLFGSTLVNGQQVATTHTFDGASWRSVGGTAPAARTGAQLAYDSVRGRVVLMGGVSGGRPLGPSDHWEYDGIAWTQVAATTPVQRFYLSLGFDPARNRLVAHDYQGQTFELVGGAWTMVGKRGPTSPLNSAIPMRYDPSRGGLLLRARGISPSPSMHIWNGATWSQLGERVGDYAFDPMRGTALVQDGTTTYLASYTHAATVASGSGCGSTADAPILSAFRRPRIGEDEFRLDLRADAVFRPVILGFGLQIGLLSLGQGCTFYLGESFASDVWFTDAYGFSSRPLAIPDALELRGLQVHAQGCVLDPVAPLGFALSQALTLRIGD